LNLQQRLAKTNFWPLQTQFCMPYVMQLVNQRSCIADKANPVCVLRRLSE
jgi:hypothetical protein